MTFLGKLYEMYFLICNHFAEDERKLDVLLRLHSCHYA